MRKYNEDIFCIENSLFTKRNMGVKDRQTVKIRDCHNIFLTKSAKHWMEKLFDKMFKDSYCTLAIEELQVVNTKKFKEFLFCIRENPWKLY